MANLHALAAYTRRKVQTRPDGCELCGAALGDAHPHVVALEDAALRCACGACAVLFRDAGSGGGRWRTVPDRVLRDGAFSPDDGEWAALEIPVGLAYVVNQTAGGRVAFYPSPAGPTPAPLGDEAWQRLAARTPLAGAVQDDVEALLLYRRRGQAAECFLVPVDACYELVGLVRRHWRGLSGGDAAWQAIDAFFDGLRARAARGGDR
jgi:hypothetical protein